MERIRPFFHAAAQFLSPFAAYPTVSLQRCKLFAVFPAPRFLSALSVRSFCSRRCKLSVAIPPFRDRFFTPLRSFCRFFRFRTSARSFCSHSRKVFAVFWLFLDLSFTQLRSFCRFFARIRLFLYAAAQFLPFYRLNPTETLHRCTVFAVFSAFSRPFLYVTAQFLPFFQFRTFFPYLLSTMQKIYLLTNNALITLHYE
ncbi:hypothetical protein HXT42_01245 [Gardnerella sp. DNF01192]|uniref:hypothetical protein n=1 Tax=Gardnerella sp. DNF01192 TaxID=2749064 RepID=UPI003BAA9DB4